MEVQELKGEDQNHDRQHESIPGGSLQGQRIYGAAEKTLNSRGCDRACGGKGFQLTAEDLTPSETSAGELSDDELDTVSKYL